MCDGQDGLLRSLQDCAPASAVNLKVDEAGNHMMSLHLDQDGFSSFCEIFSAGFDASVAQKKSPGFQNSLRGVNPSAA